jgi:membrane-bound lytic murein transglycosylase MltF
LKAFTARFYVRIILFIYLAVFPACSDTHDAQKTAEGEAVDGQPGVAQLDEEALFSRIDEPFKEDLTRIRERKLIRVLVNYSKTNFFFTGAEPRGFEYELLSEYEKYLNKPPMNIQQQIRMVFLPVPFDQLLMSLQDGRGDIAAAGLTITPEREKHVTFTNPYIPDAREVVVVSNKVKDITTVSDLSGRMVYVHRGSSYVTHLKALSEQFVQQGRSPLKVVESDRNLVTEDILELVNAGVVSITVADQHIAEAWSEVLPDIVVRQDLQVNAGGSIAWAVRKENPALLAHLNDFIKEHRKGSLMGNILFKRYYQNSKWIKNPIAEQERKKLENLIALFTKYANRYEFDWLAIAAQAYQESGLDHNKRSPKGAIGIMQVLQSTASDKSLNIRDIHLLENNIHAGVKYLQFLRDRYFSSPEIEPASRVNLSWAAYNAGPAKVNKLRRIAKERGFDPNKWFFNVEKIAAEVIGRETVTYVANINKYYVAYRLYYEKSQLRGKSIKALSAAVD